MSIMMVGVHTSKNKNIKRNFMDLLKSIFEPATLALLIPIVAIVGAFGVSAFKAHHRHVERIEKIKHGFDPDLE